MMIQSGCDCYFYIQIQEIFGQFMEELILNYLLKGKFFMNVVGFVMSFIL